MEHFLSNETRAWNYLNSIPAGDIDRRSVLRPMLLYFGYYQDQTGHVWTSYDRAIPDSVLFEWFDSLTDDFDLVMIMEYYDISLAVLMIKLCWSIDDVVYLKVNEQTKTNIQLSQRAVDTLHQLNRPDYLLYSFLNATFWRTVDKIGKDNTLICCFISLKLISISRLVVFLCFKWNRNEGVD